MASYPADEDGEALARIEVEGSDMSRPMEVEFFIAVPGEEDGVRVSDAVSSFGFSSSVELDDQVGEWTCYATKEMVLTYEAIVKAQKELELLCEPMNGQVDGWGTYGNGPAS